MNYNASINQDNINLLNDTMDLINKLTIDAFTHKSLLFNADSPGAHVRHVIEHYELFLEGLSTGKINYDHRQRNLKISNDPNEAILKIKELIGQLNVLNQQDLIRIVDVKMDTGKICGEVKTSISRELQFLWSHHVHHNAIIRMILESSGESCDKNFGIAASTKKFKEQQDQCAH